MSFVVLNIETGRYLKGRYGETDDLQKARTYARKADATNSAQYGRIAEFEVIPVRLVRDLQGDDTLASAFERHG